MPLKLLFEQLAKQHDDIATTFRQIAAEIDVADGEDVLSRAKLAHPLLGARQLQILEVVAVTGGISHPDTARRLDGSTAREQNVFQAMKKLVELGLLEKDASTSPITYRLGPELAA